MARMTLLDKRWEELMDLCRKEAEFQTDNHPKLVKYVAEEIDRRAREMGFTDKQIATREFRAERNGEHIVRILTGNHEVLVAHDLRS